MRYFGIIHNTDKEESGEAANSLRNYLTGRGAGAWISGDGKDLPECCECAVVLGGDGTLLRAAKVVLDRQLPLLGVNLGNLGYLAEIDKNGISAAADRLLSDDFQIERRMMLWGRILRAGMRTAGNLNTDNPDADNPDADIPSTDNPDAGIPSTDNPDADNPDFALNEIVLNRLGPLRSFCLKNYVNGEFLNTYNADGIILSTATGSTGYSLSVGGPIVSPGAELILMTPLAAHSLISRSIIFSGSDRIRVEIGEGRTGYVKRAVSIRFDGGGGQTLGTGDAVEVVRSPKYTNIIKLNNISFLEVLRRKMSDV